MTDLTVVTEQLTAFNLTISCRLAIHSNSSKATLIASMMLAGLTNNTTIEGQPAPIMTNIQTLQLVPPSSSRK